MTPKTAFQGELMLAGWSETHTGGAKVTFWLPDAESLDVFRSMTVRKGNTAGQRFMAVLVEIGDDEQPKAPEAPAAKGGSLAKSAAMLCDTDQFQRFAFEKLDDISRPTSGWDATVSASQNAAQFIREFCKVSSRAEIDHSPTARQLFGQLMADYRAWQASS